jgi:uncharacterized protein (DUF305 family)
MVMTKEEVNIILEKLREVAFEMKGMSAADKKDAKFLKDMIAHHEMALKMSKPMVGSARLGDFAKKIIDVQSKEIEQMKKWLREWFDESPNMEM